MPAHLHIPSFALFKEKQASGHAHLFDLAMIKKKLLDERLTAKDQSLKELMILLDHFPKLHEELMHTFLIETYCYLANQSFMQRVHQRIRIGIPVQQPCIIVAHSLGSVIAYNLLRQMCNISNIQGFITLGSLWRFVSFSNTSYSLSVTPNVYMVYGIIFTLMMIFSQRFHLKSPHSILIHLF